MKAKSTLRIMFILGAAIDGAIAITWFLIAAGWEIPNILSGYVGSGSDYQFAMYVAAMFMAGWTAILAWGALKPIERRGLLPITSGFLVVSVIIEFLCFYQMLGGPVFWFGVTKRLILSTLFIWAYCYSLKAE